MLYVHLKYKSCLSGPFFHYFLLPQSSVEKYENMEYTVHLSRIQAKSSTKVRTQKNSNKINWKKERKEDKSRPVCMFLYQLR